MADKKPKQLDFFDELQKRKAAKRKERAKKAVQKALPAPKGKAVATTETKGTPARANTRKDVQTRQGGTSVKPKVHSGEYIPKDKPVGDAKGGKGNTYEGKKADPKLSGSKAASVGSKGSKFLRLLKLGGRAIPYVGAAATMLDIAMEAKDSPRDNVDRRGRPKDEPKKAAPVADKPAPKKEEAAPAKKETSSGSFKEAFAAARKSYQNGDGGTTFTWNGKKYSVATKDDVKKAGKKDLREYLNAGLKPEQKKKTK